MTAPAPAPTMTAAQAATLAGLSGQAAAAMAQQWLLAEQFAVAMAKLWVGAFGRSLSVPSRSQMEAFLARVKPLALGTQRTMAALVLAQLNAQIPGTGITVPPEAVVGAAALRGIDEDEMYARVLKSIAKALDRGRTVEQALDEGRRRFDSLVRTNLQLAKTHTAQAFLSRADENPRNDVVGFRRTLSNNPNHCALCVLASTQRYRTGDLQPMHPGCGCGVAPIKGTADPGQVLDPELVRRVHDIVERDLGRKYVDPGGRLGDAHYRDIVIVNEHGELGPVLGVRGQFFAGPDVVDLGKGNRRINPRPEPAPEPVDLDALEAR